MQTLSISPSQIIRIKGARQHNLHNLDLTIPKNQLVVITGPSGSGKSSLAFDTLFAEGQRRYVESLSVYARQFLDRLQKPDVDFIEGLSPAIAIGQHINSSSSRSTIATTTEIYDYLRLLFSSIGTAHDPQTGEIIRPYSVQQIVDNILTFAAGTRIILLAPLQVKEGESYQSVLERARREGFVRLRINREIIEIDTPDPFVFEKKKTYFLEAVVDRLILGDGIKPRLQDSLETALKWGGNRILLFFKGEGDSEWKEQYFSTDCCNPKTGFTISKLTTKSFSFNSHLGACPTCHGLGKVVNEEIEKLCAACKGKRLKPEILAVTLLEQQENKEIREWNIYDYCTLSIKKAHEVLTHLKFNESEYFIVKDVLREISKRLQFLEEVGLGYLTLDRISNTLSGGEAQRIRLATQVGSALSGVLYVLDEPSIGLHPCDHERLIKTLHHLRDLGNSVIVVEHDEETMLAADYIFDLGPGAGPLGGKLIAEGNAEELKANPESLTGQYLSRALTILSPQKQKIPSSKNTDWLTIVGAEENNLKKIDVHFPLGCMTCVTGVSGSGKSTLINEILYPALAHRLYKSTQRVGKYETILGLEKCDKVIVVDQTPIGRTPKSNPATYIEIFSAIREIFANLPAAKMRGYTPSYFSFNTKGGRCEHCRGEGMRRIEMHFLPDVFVSCDACDGKRYQREALEITFKGRSIAQVLEMNVEEALSFFSPIPIIHRKLKRLQEVGLGYLKLGQSATTLSGGEAQRLKLASELAKPETGKTLYLLDEPTTGLYFTDIQKLLDVLLKLRDRGNTLIIIEHHLDLIRTADWVIDLGPEGGDGGGQLIVAGTPEEVAACLESVTGKFLKQNNS